MFITLGQLDLQGHTNHYISDKCVIIVCLLALLAQLDIHGRSQDIALKENEAYQIRSTVTRREPTQAGDEGEYYEITPQ